MNYDLIAINYNIIIGIIVIFFVIMFFFSYHIGDSSKEQLIPGFWTVSEDFKEKSKLEQLIVYFGEGDGYEYKGYMVITSNGETLFNDVLNFRITPQGYFKAGKYTVMTSIDTKVMPQNMTMEINVYTGLMELYDTHEKVLYARLYKDNQMSAKTVLKIGDSDQKSIDNEPIGEVGTNIPDSEDISTNTP
jgi:hypothetical protein